MKNLLGPDPDQAMQEFFSNEKQVSSETPPTFLVHTHEDRAVPSENSIYFYVRRCRSNQARVFCHIASDRTCPTPASMKWLKFSGAPAWA